MVGTMMTMIRMKSCSVQLESIWNCRIIKDKRLLERCFSHDAALWILKDTCGSALLKKHLLKTMHTFLHTLRQIARHSDNIVKVAWTLSLVKARHTFTATRSSGTVWVLAQHSQLFRKLHPLCMIGPASYLAIKSISILDLCGLADVWDYFVSFSSENFFKHPPAWTFILLLR